MPDGEKHGPLDVPQQMARPINQQPTGLLHENRAPTHVRVPQGSPQQEIQVGR